MNNQEAFEKVVAHLKAQGTRSIHENGEDCAYAGQHGLSCAVGCLLPRELGERLDMLQSAAWPSVVRAAAHGHADAKEAVTMLDGVSSDLLTSLQQAHDMASDDDFWFWTRCSSRLRIVAGVHGLTLPPELQS